jgi:hypothetical protein
MLLSIKSETGNEEAWILLSGWLTIPRPPSPYLHDKLKETT